MRPALTRRRRTPDGQRPRHDAGTSLRPLRRPAGVESRRPEPSKVKLRAWVDGGARGNPGPAGFGAVVTDESGVELSRLWRFLGETTNNVAEYEGLIAALEESLALGAFELTVMTDSQLVQRQMTGVYKIKQKHLQRLASRAHALLLKFARCEIVHVPRAKNVEADALANRAMDERSSGREPAGSHAGS